MHTQISVHLMRKEFWGEKLVKKPVIKDYHKACEWEGWTEVT